MLTSVSAADNTQRGEQSTSLKNCFEFVVFRDVFKIAQLEPRAKHQGGAGKQNG